eukprot:TRINITY_DN3366_c0_g1_i16.p1 TRINITY_DN3366_c0_g1~~TRINITY_DN3366_c0_g1_i16.p1  ORF type:complete len:156 (-),score=7.35 TRINITY_DN3366_c0_g1_i16:82-549(-)
MDEQVQKFLKNYGRYCRKFDYKYNQQTSCCSSQVMDCLECGQEILVKLIVNENNFAVKLDLSLFRYFSVFQLFFLSFFGGSNDWKKNCSSIRNKLQSVLNNLNSLGLKFFLKKLELLRVQSYQEFSEIEVTRKSARSFHLKNLVLGAGTSQASQI